MALGKSWLHSGLKMVWPLLLTAATGQRPGLLRRTVARSLAALTSWRLLSTIAVKLWAGERPYTHGSKESSKMAGWQNGGGVRRDDNEKGQCGSPKVEPKEGCRNSGLTG